MRKLAATAAAIPIALTLLGGCSAGYYDRGGYAVGVGLAPEWYGTVTYVDPYASRFDVEYFDNGVRYVRPVYYGRGTAWDGMAYRDLRMGDRVYVRGRENRGNWRAQSVRRYR